MEVNIIEYFIKLINNIKPISSILNNVAFINIQIRSFVKKNGFFYIKKIVYVQIYIKLNFSLT